MSSWRLCLCIVLVVIALDAQGYLLMGAGLPLWLTCVLDFLGTILLGWCCFVFISLWRRQAR